MGAAVLLAKVGTNQYLLKANITAKVEEKRRKLQQKKNLVRFFRQEGHRAHARTWTKTAWRAWPVKARQEQAVTTGRGDGVVVGVRVKGSALGDGGGGGAALGDGRVDDDDDPETSPAAVRPHMQAESMSKKKAEEE